jgi:hypothetical protein
MFMVRFSGAFQGTKTKSAPQLLSKRVARAMQLRTQKKRGQFVRAFEKKQSLRGTMV